MKYCIAYILLHCLHLGRDWLSTQSAVAGGDFYEWICAVRDASFAIQETHLSRLTEIDYRRGLIMRLWLRTCLICLTKSKAQGPSVFLYYLPSQLKHVYAIKIPDCVFVKHTCNNNENVGMPLSTWKKGSTNEKSQDTNSELSCWIAKWHLDSSWASIYYMCSMLYQNSVNLWRARLLLYIVYFTWVVIGCQLDLLLLGDFYEWICTVHATSSASQETHSSKVYRIWL